MTPTDTRDESRPCHWVDTLIRTIERVTADPWKAPEQMAVTIGPRQVLDALHAELTRLMQHESLAQGEAEIQCRWCKSTNTGEQHIEDGYGSGIARLCFNCGARGPVR